MNGPDAWAAERVGRRLRELRLKQSLTLDDVAESFGVYRSTISMYETGKRAPSYARLLGFCAYYGVTPNDLLF